MRIQKYINNMEFTSVLYFFLFHFFFKKKTSVIIIEFYMYVR